MLQSIVVSRLALAIVALCGPLALASPAAAQTKLPYGCACVNNETTLRIGFRYRFGNKPFSSSKIASRGSSWICHTYPRGSASSPDLQFMMDVDARNGKEAWTTYSLVRGQSRARSCSAVPRLAQYGVRYRAGTNNQIIELYKR